jgi:cysteine-rich repeat protein
MVAGHWQLALLATILVVPTTCGEPPQAPAGAGLTTTVAVDADVENGSGDDDSASATDATDGSGQGEGESGEGESGESGGSGGPEPACGNGLVELVEECDLGLNNSDTGLCKTDCTNQVCGDGFSGPGEECDDGNAIDDDVCSTLCENNVDFQCVMPYHVLNLADRNVQFNDGDGNVEWCDRTNSAAVDSQWHGLGWYRLMAPAGTRLPVEPPKEHSCGTEAPGWMLAEHPAILDGVVLRTACFAWANNICEWESPLEVVNCGDFYLYRLLNA